MKCWIHIFHCSFLFSIIIIVNCCRYMETRLARDNKQFNVRRTQSAKSFVNENIMCIERWLLYNYNYMSWKWRHTICKCKLTQYTFNQTQLHTLVSSLVHDSNIDTLYRQRCMHRNVVSFRFSFCRRTENGGECKTFSYTRKVPVTEKIRVHFVNLLTLTHIETSNWQQKKNT